MKHHILTVAAAAAALSGCATTDIAKSANFIKKARTAQQLVGGTMEAVNPGDGPVAASTASLASAAPISDGPMAIPMRRMDGKEKILAHQPRLALVGYNVGGYTSAKATGKASGDLLGYSQGSRSTIEMTATGITPELLQRVADYAHDDLVAKLRAAGVDVVPAQDVRATPSADKLKFAPAPYETKLTTELGKKSVVVAGPSGVGPQQHLGIGKRAMGGNAIVRPSAELQAVMVMPNLVLDFAALKARGGALTSRSSASGQVRFAVDASSRFNIQSSKGRFLDGWLNYGIKKPVVADADFAVVGEASTKSNTLERGLGAALGMATAKKSTKSMIVSVDPDRYEALARSAAAGWNDAFVAQITAARGG